MNLLKLEQIEREINAIQVRHPAIDNWSNPKFRPQPVKLKAGEVVKTHKFESAFKPAKIKKIKKGVGANGKPIVIEKIIYKFNPSEDQKKTLEDLKLDHLPKNYNNIKAQSLRQENTERDRIKKRIEDLKKK